MAPPKGTLLFKTGERCRRTILVCDMPERKQFNQRRWRPVHYVADVAQMPRLSVRGHKKWPRKPGPFVESISPHGLAAQEAATSEALHLQGLRGRNREGPHCAGRRGPRSSADDRWR